MREGLVIQWRILHFRATPGRALSPLNVNIRGENWMFVKYVHEVVIQGLSDRLAPEPPPAFSEAVAAWEAHQRRSWEELLSAACLSHPRVRGPRG
jgi:hypothetical protein